MSDSLRTLLAVEDPARRLDAPHALAVSAARAAPRDNELLHVSQIDPAPRWPWPAEPPLLVR